MLFVSILQNSRYMHFFSQFFNAGFQPWFPSSPLCRSLYFQTRNPTVPQHLLSLSYLPDTFLDAAWAGLMYHPSTRIWLFRADNEWMNLSPASFFEKCEVYLRPCCQALCRHLSTFRSASLFNVRCPLTSVYLYVVHKHAKLDEKWEQPPWWTAPLLTYQQRLVVVLVRYFYY